MPLPGPDRLDSCKDLIEGCKQYVAREKRDPWYALARSIVDEFWEGRGHPRARLLTAGVSALLLAWNTKYYTDGPFDCRGLADQIELKSSMLSAYRSRTILDFAEQDHAVVRDLFDSFDRTVAGWRKRTGPVSTSKVLHVLAPSFFPMWDTWIARGLGFPDTLTSYDYVRFMQKTAAISHRLTEVFVAETGNPLSEAWLAIARLHPLYPAENRSLLKMLDEYNYVLFTLRSR